MMVMGFVLSECGTGCSVVLLARGSGNGTGTGDTGDASDATRYGSTPTAQARPRTN